MIYVFARIIAVLNVHVEDYYWQGNHRRLRLREKNGKEIDDVEPAEVARIVVWRAAGA